MALRLYRCSACDHTISEIAAVCPGCGAPGDIARQPKSTSTAAQSESAEPIAAETPPAPKRSGWKVVGVFILYLIAFVMGVAYLFAYVVIFLIFAAVALVILSAVLGGAH
jgi:hypothetical protein